MVIWNKVGEFKYKVMYLKYFLIFGNDNIYNIYCFLNGYLKFLNVNVR